jgi:hypothetical protein
MATSGPVQLKPEDVRRRPRLPHPAWGLLFVAVAIVDFLVALGWLMYGGPREQPSPELVGRLEMDIGLGLVLALLLSSGWFWATSRDMRPALERFIQRRARFRPANWLGVLFITLLYAATFLPIIFLGPEGLAGRALAAVPLDLAMAVIMFDLGRLRREAQVMIREITGQPAPVSSALEAARELPEVAGLRPEDLLAAPRWWYNLPGLLGLVQAALLLVGATEIPQGWAREPRLIGGVPWELAIWGGAGVLIGLWGVWHEWRQLRRPGRALQIALRAIRKERRDFPFYLWDWWGYTVILAALAVALAAIFPLQEPQMRLAGGALVLGYGLGITPLYPFYARPWRLAREILGMVRG